MTLLTAGEETDLREIVKTYVNTYCVFRCDPDVQYAPNIPKGTIPGSMPGKYSKWQIYLRRMTQHTDLMAATCMLLMNEMMRNNEPKDGLQMVGLETSCIPLISYFQAYSRPKEFFYNSFIIRKNRKDYGLFNFVDGRPQKQPVMIVDDIVHSGGTMNRVLDTCLYELDLDPHYNAYFILNLDPKTSFTVFNGYPIKINSILTRDDLDLEYSKDKYWLPDDCQKIVNFRPDYK